MNYKHLFIVLGVLFCDNNAISQENPFWVDYRYVQKQKVGSYTYKYCTPRDTFSATMDMLNFIDNGDDEVGILIRDSSYVIKNHPAFSITVGDSYASNSYPHPKAFVNDSVTYPFPYEIFVMWKFKDLLGFLAPGYPYRFIRPFAGFLNLNTTPTCLEPLPWYGHFGAVYYLSEKIEIHGKRLYKLKYISMDWQSAPCNTNFGLDKDLYLDLWYWEDVGYTYARICVEGELHTLELTHIEGCPLDEYVRTCKNSMCKYYGE